MRVTTVGTPFGYPVMGSVPVVTRQDLDLSTPIPAVTKTEKTETTQKPIDRDLGRVVDIKV